MKSNGVFDEDNRGTNLLDTGAHFYDVYRCADGEYISHRVDRAAVLRRAAAAHRPRRAIPSSSGRWTRTCGRTSRPAPAGVRDQDARRVVRDHGAHRRVLRPGADDERGRRAPAQHRPQPVHRRRRRAAAGPRAAVLAHRCPPSTAPPAQPGQHSPRGAHGLGLRRSSGSTTCSPAAASRPPAERALHGHPRRLPRPSRRRVA